MPREPLGVEVLDVPSEDFLVEAEFAEAASVDSPSADGEGRADVSSDEGLADGLGGLYTWDFLSDAEADVRRGDCG